jgi:hypothetical protein
MRRCCGIVFFLLTQLLLPAASSASPPHLWSIGFGDDNAQIARCITADPVGGYLVAGYFQGTIDLGGDPLTSAGGYDIFLAKLDSNGDHIWSKRFGDGHDDYVTGIAASGAGHIGLTGFFWGAINFGGPNLNSAGHRDIFLVELDPDGNYIWGRRFGDGTHLHETAGCAFDGEGHLIMAGNFNAGIDLGSGSWYTSNDNYFVAKYAPNGANQWARRFTGNGWQHMFAMDMDPSGNVCFTGRFKETANIGGGHYGGSTLRVILARLDANGNHVWSRSFGLSHEGFGRAVCFDSQGNVVLGGCYSGTIDFGGGALTAAGSYDAFVARFDAGGGHEWSAIYGDASDQRFYSVDTDAFDNVVLSGIARGSIDFGGGLWASAGDWDIFFAAYDPDGAHLWSQMFGSAAEDGINDLVVNGGNDLTAVGNFRGTIDFGGGTTTTAGDWDGFVTKFGFGTIPTRLQSYDAAARGADIALEWRMSEIGAAARFHVLRSESGRPFAELYGARVTVDGLSAAFTDTGVRPGETYRYRVDVTDEDGRQALFTTETITVPVAALALGPAPPTPSNPHTTIRFTVPEAAPVELSIYDARGALVRTLVDGAVPAGSRSATWNGRDNGGAVVSSGIYLVRLVSGRQVRTSKIVLLK